MNINIEHAEMVKALVKSGQAILQSLDGQKADLIHATIGISGEAGELLDAVKKHVIYERELDRANIIEELGDLEFYMEQLRRNQGITREETLEANMKKLAKRYADYKYTNQRASERADKQ